jgi:hypothetical protein
VRWDPSGERLLPAKEKTWPAVRQLLEQSATACGRREYLDEQVDGVERPLMRLTFETAVKGGEERVVRVIAEQSHARGDLLNDTLHRAVHAYLRETMARIVRRRDFIDRDGGPQKRNRRVLGRAKSIPLAAAEELGCGTRLSGPLAARGRMVRFDGAFARVWILRKRRLAASRSARASLAGRCRHALAASARQRLRRANTGRNPVIPDESRVRRGGTGWCSARSTSAPATAIPAFASISSNPPGPTRAMRVVRVTPGGLARWFVTIVRRGVATAGRWRGLG